MEAAASMERHPGTQRDLVWTDVCAVDALVPGTGGAALVDGEQIAVVRARDGRVFALSNFDPFSKAFVVARGIVGDKGGVAKIASPIFKQNFSLETGECLDDPTVRLATYPVRVVLGRIQVAVPRGSDP
jgi:nitrite reductase (NADH) small subunit